MKKSRYAWRICADSRRGDDVSLPGIDRHRFREHVHGLLVTPREPQDLCEIHQRVALAVAYMQQYVPGSVVFPGAAGFFSGQFDNGSSATNAVGATSNGAIPNLHPDVVIKNAFDWKFGDRHFHLEAAALIRSFKAFNNLVMPNDTTMATAASGSVNLNFEVLKNFRLIANTFYGEGGGR